MVEEIETIGTVVVIAVGEKEVNVVDGCVTVVMGINVVRVVAEVPSVVTTTVVEPGGPSPGVDSAGDDGDPWLGVGWPPVTPGLPPAELSPPLPGEVEGGGLAGGEVGGGGGAGGGGESLVYSLSLGYNAWRRCMVSSGVVKRVSSKGSLQK